MLKIRLYEVLHSLLNTCSTTLHVSEYTTEVYVRFYTLVIKIFIRVYLGIYNANVTSFPTSICKTTQKRIPLYGTICAISENLQYTGSESTNTKLFDVPVNPYYNSKNLMEQAQYHETVTNDLHQAHGLLWRRICLPNEHMKLTPLDKQLSITAPLWYGVYNTTASPTAWYDLGMFYLRCYNTYQQYLQNSNTSISVLNTYPLFASDDIAQFEPSDIDVSDCNGYCAQIQKMDMSSHSAHDTGYMQVMPIPQYWLYMCLNDISARDKCVMYCFQKALYLQACQYKLSQQGLPEGDSSSNITSQNYREETLGYLLTPKSSDIGINMKICLGILNYLSEYNSSYVYTYCLF